VTKNDHQPKPKLKVEYLDNNPRLRWKGKKGPCYPLLHLAKPAGSVRLPAQRKYLDVDDLADMPRVLIFGERSGGGRDFMTWFRNGLKDKGKACIYAQGDQWRPSLFDLPGSEAEQGERTSLLINFSKGTAAERAENLIALAKTFTGESGANVIIRDLELFGGESAKSAATALRIASEREEVSALQIFIASTSESHFGDLYDSSGFAVMCERFRLAWLEKDEVQALANGFEAPPSESKQPCLELDDSTNAQILDDTGGQPLLVQGLLQLLRQSQPTKRKPDVKDLRQAYRELRSSPPPSVEHWKQDLAARLGARAELVDVTRDYVAGYSRGTAQTLPAAHASLAIAGWLRLDENTERWKIASRLHAHLAQEVLDRRGR
jgi:hypothetical protein